MQVAIFSPELGYISKNLFQIHFYNMFLGKIWYQIQTSTTFNFLTLTKNSFIWCLKNTTLKLGEFLHVTASISIASISYKLTLFFWMQVAIFSLELGYISKNLFQIHFYDMFLGKIWYQIQTSTTFNFLTLTKNSFIWCLKNTTLKLGKFLHVTASISIA